MQGRHHCAHRTAGFNAFIACAFPCDSAERLTAIYARPKWVGNGNAFRGIPRLTKLPRHMDRYDTYAGEELVLTGLLSPSRMHSVGMIPDSPYQSCFYV